MTIAVESVKSAGPSRTKRSAWSFASGLLLMALTIGVGLIATPWLIRWLGRERYGAWRVLLDSFAYLSLFDLGLAGAITGLLTPAIGRGDSLAARRIIGAGLRIYRSVTVTMVLAGCALTACLPFLIQVIDPRELWITGAILLLPLLSTASIVFRTITEATQRAYLVNAALLGQSLLITGLSLIGARWHWGLPGQAMAQACGVIAAALFLVWTGWRVYPPSRPAAGDLSVNKALWKLNWPTLTFNLSGRLGLLSDNIVVGCVLGTGAVAPFFLTQRLAALVQLQLQNIGNATWAALVELHSSGQTGVFQLQLKELSALVSGLGLALLSPIAAYNHQFISLWVGQESYAGSQVTLLACLNGWLISIFSLWGWPLTGTGKIAAWAPYSAAFSLVNLAISVYATVRHGIAGPLWGTLAGLLLVQSWALPRVLAQEFGLNQWSLISAVARPLWSGAPFAVCLWWFAHRQVVSGWTGLTLEAGAATVASLAVWWFLGLSVTTRREWQGRLWALMLPGSFPWRLTPR